MNAVSTKLETMNNSTNASAEFFLKSKDPEIFQAVLGELRRQNEHIELIASENFTSLAVLEAAGSVLTNKYAEGYPSKRWYGGCENADVVETLAIERAKALSDGGPYVFPGRSPKKPLSNMVFLMALRRMKRTDLTTHGFRSTFRDWAAERTNVPRAVCEAALAHTLRDKTEAAYNRTDLFDRRRDLMASWSKYATSKPADVVAIRA